MIALEQERVFFKNRQADWEKLYPGKFVLVQGQELIGVFDTAENAVSEGIRRFGLNPFLVRNVLEKEEELRIPALMFDLVHAIIPLPV
jgi:hypothetical protein